MAVLFRRDSPAVPAEGRPVVGATNNPATSGAKNAPEIEIEDVVQQRLITAVFQPIVHLDSREVVGYEAFARGPAGTRWENPALMFETARQAGIDWELDLVAHAAAFKAALESNLPASMSLFINANPTSVGRKVPTDLAPTLALAYSKLRVFMEMSEQALSVDPDGFLSGIEKARASGWGVSLDNVGLTPNSLALVPFARPDVIKIDVSLVHEQTHPHAPRVMNSVTAHAERTGASIMALGIETEAHLRTGRGLGAVLGQGYLFGRPGPLPATLNNPANAIPLIETLDRLFVL
jgi:EAL domain-containing protein (putative c-di-GMP-specific phosphodiesterase class I)